VLAHFVLEGKTECIVMLHTNVTIFNRFATNMRLLCVHKPPSSAPREVAGLQGRTAHPLIKHPKESEMEQIPFISSAPNTLGIELELQLIDPRPDRSL